MIEVTNDQITPYLIISLSNWLINYYYSKHLVKLNFLLNFVDF